MSSIRTTTFRDTRSRKLPAVVRSAVAPAVIVCTAVMVLSVAGPAVADTASWHSGVPDCSEVLAKGTGVAPELVAHQAFSDALTAPRPDVWCNVDLGGVGGVVYGPDGAQFGIPQSNLQTGLVHDNNELLSYTPGDIGDTMNIRVGGADIGHLDGSTGWGYWNRARDLAQFDVAWFMYQKGPGFSDVMNALRGVFAAAGTAVPDGFFFLVMKPGTNLPIAVKLDDSLLNSDHTYSISLADDQVTAFVDGQQVASVTVAPAPPPVPPMITNLWLDNQYWSPVPFSQFNPAGVSSIRMSCVSQGPTSQNPPGRLDC